MLITPSFVGLPRSILLIGVICLHIIIAHLISVDSVRQRPPTPELAPVISDAAVSPDARPHAESVPIEDGELLETFADSSRIGVPHRNKIELESYDTGSGNSLVKIRFYVRKRKAGWELKQSFEFPKNSLIDCDPHVDDFNHDGLRDFTFRSNVAARGSNDVRTLFIYDKSRDALVWIKNSEHYPNMEYNGKLDCIDAWLFHGATTTVFLRIVGDELKEIATVDTGRELIVTVFEKDGSRVLRREQMDEEDIYTRYSSFDPLQP